MVNCIMDAKILTMLLNAKTVMKLLNSVMMMMKEVIVMMMIAKRRKRLTDILNVVEVAMMMTVKMMNVVTTHTVNFMTTIVTWSSL